MADCCAAMFHGDEGKSRPQHVARRVHALGRGAKVLVHGNAPPGVEGNPRRLEPKAFRLPYRPAANNTVSQGEGFTRGHLDCQPAVLRNNAVRVDPNSTLIPYAWNTSSMQPVISSSIVGQQAIAGVSKRNRAPSAWAIVANSTPTDPAPTISISLGTRLRLRDVVRIADPRRLGSDGRRSPGTRSRGNQHHFRAELALASVVAGRSRSRVPADRALEVVDVVLCEALRCHLLQ